MYIRYAMKNKAINKEIKMNKKTMVGGYHNPYAFKNHKIGYAPIKILWIKKDKITKLGYCQTEKEADDVMANLDNRKKGIALKLYRSSSLGCYVTIPV